MRSSTGPEALRMSHLMGITRLHASAAKLAFILKKQKKKKKHFSGAEERKEKTFI